MRIMEVTINTSVLLAITMEVTTALLVWRPSSSLRHTPTPIRFFLRLVSQSLASPRSGVVVPSSPRPKSGKSFEPHRCAFSDVRQLICHAIWPGACISESFFCYWLSSGCRPEKLVDHNRIACAGLLLHSVVIGHWSARRIFLFVSV